MSPAISDAQYWEEEATKLRRTGLANVRSTAEKWQTALGAVLGIFGTVALIEGPTKLEDLGFWQGLVLVVGAAAAAAVAVLALRNAADAGQPVPKQFDNLSGPVLQEWNATESAVAINRLRKSRVYAGLAVAALFAGLGASWLFGLPWEEDEGGQKALAIVEGRALCGELGAGQEGLTLAIAGGPPIALASATEVTPVDSCPKAP